MWYDPQDKSYLDGSSRSKQDDLGFALSFDQKITRKTTAFFRYGWADDKVNEVEDFVSFGGQIEGLVEGRDEDVFAVGYVRGLRSPNGLSGEEERQIDLIETYYSVKINDNLIITPNIQLVMDPGGLKGESPATVFGLRFRVTF
jgi:carbohydrate-selective porin OprB